jgi:hypothetical protein
MTNTLSSSEGAEYIIREKTFHLGLYRNPGEVFYLKICTALILLTVTSQEVFLNALFFGQIL